ncbi:Chromatin structure-remodeling complex subunit RSC2 [Smittium mucronatum]|uniref:Chromatin structure-remodeling complex subunit RSC2 n=1 Tax=Smittium mucronatum TaxID=133383 RepID=A0A1R0GZG5_9FUNG|nr:Chromatin structure-remodeling complex subunit RSC2 [Smittium mucronatum]
MQSTPPRKKARTELVFQNENSESYQLRNSFKNTKKSTPSSRRVKSNFVHLDPNLYDSIKKISVNGQTLENGDFVHIKNSINDFGPLVGHIYKIWKKLDTLEEGVLLCWYLHSWQTVHKINQLFYKNEVFKSSGVQSVGSSEIIGKCFVLPANLYTSGYPSQLQDLISNSSTSPAKFPDQKTIDKYVYVLESRYNETNKNFSPIKDFSSIWPETASNEKISQLMQITNYPKDSANPRTMQKFKSIFANDDNSTSSSPRKRKKSAENPQLLNSEKKTTKPLSHSNSLENLAELASARTDTTKPKNSYLHSVNYNLPLEMSRNAMISYSSPMSNLRPFSHSLNQTNPSMYSANPVPGINNRMSTLSSAPSENPVYQRSATLYASNPPISATNNRANNQSFNNINSTSIEGSNNRSNTDGLNSYKIQETPYSLRTRNKNVQSTEPINSSFTPSSQLNLTNNGIGSARNINRTEPQMEPSSGFEVTNQQKNIFEKNKNYSCSANEDKQIDPDIVKHFPLDSNGKIKWFATPPVIPPVINKPTHSESYLKWKHSKEAKEPK